VSKHTPTPWIVDRNCDNDNIVVRSVPDQGIVANCQCDSYAFDDQKDIEGTWQANADRIVLCVNAHEELVEAAKLAHAVLIRNPNLDDIINGESVEVIMQDVLAKLEGGSK
jgi:hypothetical protein